MAYILVVDDALDSVEPICALLKKSGHETVCALNGREALSAILSRIPDLMLLDLLMPEMDGAHLLQVLRSYLRLQNLPVIVFTGAQDSPLAAQVPSLGVETVLAKGKCLPLDVVAAINSALAGPLN